MTANSWGALNAARTIEFFSLGFDKMTFPNECLAALRALLMFGPISGQSALGIERGFMEV